MHIHVANRGPVAEGGLVDRYFPLSDLQAFWGSADAFVVTVPLTPATRGIVGQAAFAAMRSHAYVINVARGPVIDEAALYDALHTRRIGGAAIDTWYQYPTDAAPNPPPSTLDFASLPNLLMTPHMSGWTDGTIRRRQATMAANILRRQRNESLENVVKAG
jgi:phosphoglycerate dehydrogenase-like enzyme